MGFQIKRQRDALNANGNTPSISANVGGSGTGVEAELDVRQHDIRVEREGTCRKVENHRVEDRLLDCLVVETVGRIAIEIDQQAEQSACRLPPRRSSVSRASTRRQILLPERLRNSRGSNPQPNSEPRSVGADTAQSETRRIEHLYPPLRGRASGMATHRPLQPIRCCLRAAGRITSSLGLPAAATRR